MAELEQRVRPEQVDALRHRVGSALRDDGGTDGLFDRPEFRPTHDAMSVESCAENWGYIYGLAYAIARAEDPYEQSDDVAARANAVAKPIYAEYVGDAHGEEVAV